MQIDMMTEVMGVCGVRQVAIGDFAYGHFYWHDAGGDGMHELRALDELEVSRLCIWCFLVCGGKRMSVSSAVLGVFCCARAIRPA